MVNGKTHTREVCALHNVKRWLAASSPSSMGIWGAIPWNVENPPGGWPSTVVICADLCTPCFLKILTEMRINSEPSPGSLAAVQHQWRPLRPKEFSTGHCKVLFHLFLGSCFQSQFSHFFGILYLIYLPKATFVESLPPHMKHPLKPWFTMVHTSLIIEGLFNVRRMGLLTLSPKISVPFFSPEVNNSPKLLVMEWASLGFQTPSFDQNIWQFDAWRIVDDVYPKLDGLRLDLIHLIRSHIRYVINKY